MIDNIDEDELDISIYDGISIDFMKKVDEIAKENNRFTLETTKNVPYTTIYTKDQKINLPVVLKKNMPRHHLGLKKIEKKPIYVYPQSTLALELPVSKRHILSKNPLFKKENNEKVEIVNITPIKRKISELEQKNFEKTKKYVYLTDFELNNFEDVKIQDFVFDMKIMPINSMFNLASFFTLKFGRGFEYSSIIQNIKNNVYSTIITRNGIISKIDTLEYIDYSNMRKKVNDAFKMKKNMTMDRLLGFLNMESNIESILDIFKFIFYNEEYAIFENGIISKHKNIYQIFNKEQFASRINFLKNETEKTAFITQYYLKLIIRRKNHDEESILSKEQSDYNLLMGVLKKGMKIKFEHISCSKIIEKELKIKICINRVINYQIIIGKHDLIFHMGENGMLSCIERNIN